MNEMREKFGSRGLTGDSFHHKGHRGRYARSRSRRRCRHNSSMADGFLLRTATVDDAAIIARHRALMFLDMGSVTLEESEALIAAAEPWVAELLSKGEYLGWLIEEDEEIIVGGGGVHLRELPPGPGCLKVGRWAHIVNVYTIPTHRRHGLARMVMNEMLRWCDANQIDLVTLTASDEGRPLYESLGFFGSAEMRLGPRYKSEVSSLKAAASPMSKVMKP